MGHAQRFPRTQDDGIKTFNIFHKSFFPRKKESAHFLKKKPSFLFGGGGRSSKNFEIDALRVLSPSPHLPLPSLLSCAPEVASFGLWQREEEEKGGGGGF